MNLESSISEVKNIGEQRMKKFHKLGIMTVKDLIEYFPRDYDDRSNIIEISQLKENENGTIRALISSEPETIRIKNVRITRVKISDKSGIITASWFNQEYLKNTFKKGQEYFFNGKFQIKYGKKELISPEYELIKEGNILSSARIVPVYSATQGISQKIFRSIIRSVLDETQGQLYDFIPKWIRIKYKLCDRNFAVENIHFPIDNDSFFQARRRLVFEELFMLQLSLLRIKMSVNNGKKGIKFKKDTEIDEILKGFSFELTNAQKKVIDEIKKDTTKGKVMNRLVQGDVGSGKTAVAMVEAYIAIKNGYQVAMMAPTEVLAKQHYNSFCEIFEALGIKTVLLTSAIKKKEKMQIIDDITSGETKMIIGTHAVIQDNVIFNKLGLVITDEQHRFGVRQREILSSKGNNPHVLVMTATPIPRTLALILYGDLDISIIDELPPGRQKIDTLCVPPSYHQRIYKFIRDEVGKGRQAYVICPAIEESEKLDVIAATTYAKELKDSIFSDLKVECIHGKMKADEKQKIMESFSAGEIDILVSTTVIEVGINVPNSTIMLIENAERFGLAQLHQLRGRVGRGSEKSYCILVTESKTNVTKQRMKVMKESNDGFVISEKDLKLRGPGEFFGTKQHGIPELKIANLYKDIDVLKDAQSAAEEIINNDFKLNMDEHSLLKKEIIKNINGENICI